MASKHDLMLGLSLDATRAMAEARRLAEQMQRTLGAGATGAGATSSAIDGMADRLRDAGRRAAETGRALDALGRTGAGDASRAADELGGALRRTSDAAGATGRALRDAVREGQRIGESGRAAEELGNALRRAGEQGGSALQGAANGASRLGQQLEQAGTAATGAGRDMRQLEQAADGAARAMGRISPAKSLSAARDVLDIRSFQQIEREIQQVQAAYKRLADSGKLSHQELQYAAQAQEAQIARLRGEMQKFGAQGQVSAGQTAAAFRQLPMQMQDVFVSLAGGMNPLMVLAQQGPQITSSFGGVKETLKAVGGAITPMAAGIGLGVVAVAALAAAYHQGSSEADAYAKALIMTGNAAGSTIGQMQQVAVRVSDVVGTQAAAAEAVAALAGTGRVAAADLERLTLVTVQWERATGQAASEVAKQFSDLGKAPLEASLRLNESMRYLTQATYAQISALQEEGRTQEAAQAAQEAYAAALEQRSAQIVDRLGYLEKGWRSLKDVAASAWDTMLGIGRKQTIEGALAESAEKIQRLEAAAGKSALVQSRMGSLEREKQRQKDLQIEASDAAKRAGNRAAEAKQLEARVKWDKEGDKFLDNRERREREITKIRNEGVAAGIAQVEIEKRVKATQEKYKDDAPKRGPGIAPVQATIVAKATAEAAAERQAAQDRTAESRAALERRYAAELVTAADYYAELRRMAQQDSADRIAQIDKQIAAEAARKVDPKRAPQDADKQAARLIELRAAREHELSQQRVRESDIEAKADAARRAEERRALEESRGDMQQWASTMEALRKQVEDGAAQVAQAEAQAITDPLLRARAEARVAADEILRTSEQAAVAIRAQADVLAGRGQTAAADALREQLAASQRAAQARADIARRAPDTKALQDYLGADVGYQIAEGFDKASQSLSAFTRSFAAMVKGQEDYQRALAGAGTDADKIAKVEAQRAKEQVNAYGTMAGAAKGFFKEGSRGYKTLEKAEKGFRAVELAMAIKTAATKMGLIGAVTTAKVAGDQQQIQSTQSTVGPEVNAALQKGQANAAAAGAKQASGGDPYTAFARVAAMVALMAALGFSVRGGKGASVPPEQRQSEVLGGAAASSAERQQFAGTGTVLGDQFAKSESIARSIDALTGVDTLTMRYSAQMLASLRSIEASMAGVSTQILRAGGITTGANLGIQTGTISRNQGDPILNAIGGGALNSLVTNIPVLGGIISGLQRLWGRTSAEITDAGLALRGTVAEMRAGGGVSQYADVTTTRTSFFGLRRSTTQSTQMADVSDDLTRQFALIFGNVSDSLRAAAGAMGQDAAAVGRRLADYVIEIPRLSLRGLSGEALQEAIATSVGATADAMARMIAPGLADFQRVGEGYYETVVRVATSTEQAGAVLRQLGVTQIDAASLQRKQADDMVAELVRESIMLAERGTGGVSSAVAGMVENLSGSAQEIADAYRTLREARLTFGMMGMDQGLSQAAIAGAGGLDALTGALGEFEARFYSDAERVEFNSRRMSEQFGRLGLSMPATMEGFRSLVTGMDTSTEAGQTLLGQVLLLSGGFADLMDASGKAAEAVASLTDEQRVQTEATMRRLGIGRGADVQAAAAGAGGIEALSSGMSDYEKRFFSDAEQFAMQSAKLAEQFRAIGVAMPDSSEGFRALVSGVDASTEAGSRLLGSLLPLSGGFADLMDRMGQLKTATGSLGKGIEDEITRIRGAMGQREGQTLAETQAGFVTATAQARAGDAAALESLPGLSQALLRQAESQSVTREDYIRLQAQTAASLQETLDRARSASAAASVAVAAMPALGVAASETPGLNAPASSAATEMGGSAVLAELQALRAETASLRAELQGMRAESASGLTSVVAHTSRAARILDRVTAGGDTIQTTEVTQ